MAKMVLKYELDLLEDRDLIRPLVNAFDFRDCLQEIDVQLRTTLKHDDSEWINDKAYKYLEGLREIIADSGALEYD